MSGTTLVPDKIIRCQYCNGYAKLCDSAELYGRSYGLIFWCRPCDAYVGVHKGTTEPKGTVAKYELREARKAAHAAFDAIWDGHREIRSACYAWLADRMGLPIDKTHIGMFDEAASARVVEIVNAAGIDAIRDMLCAAPASAGGGR